MNKNYIISKKIDLFLFSFSGIFIFFLLKTLDENGYIFLILVLAISVILDNGHIYITFSRVQKELKTEKIFFIFTPLVIFLIMFFWLEIRIPYFWNIIVYFTFFHFLRQIFGINKWYHYLEKRKSKIDDFFLYALISMPLISLHFQPDLFIVLYTENDFFLYPSTSLYNFSIFINMIVLLSWIFYEYRTYKFIKKINLYRVAFVGSNTFLFILVGYFSDGFIEILIPIMMAHGSQYLFLSADFENKKHNISFEKSLIILFFIALVFGAIDTFFQDLLLIENDYLNKNLFENILLSMLLTPLLTHYIFDMLMWKSTYINRIIK